MKFKHFFLFIIIPLSEIKAIFYNSDKKVDWYLFSENKRYLCNVLETYSNIIIFGIIMYYWIHVKKDRYIIMIGTFLIILNALDLIHLGLLDKQYFIIAKLILAFLINLTWFKLKPI